MILIDLDEKDENKIIELQEKYGETIRVLGRREIENYFLDSYEEIAMVVNSNYGSDVTTANAIKELVVNLLSQSENKHFYRTREIQDPMTNIIGSRVLELIFKEYDIYYNKISHGVELVKYILHNNPEKLIPIKNMLEEFITA
jgi:hypothetical protein